MKLLDIQAALGTAILFLSQPCDAKHGSHSHLEALARRHSHKRLHASPRAESVVEEGLEKRGTCEFPTNLGFVAVTPGEQNAGWAMSPDQPCTRGTYCPYACPCGQVSMQWDPSATSYPSLNGGLYCDSNGQIQKPISANEYCQDGVGSVAAQNECGSAVSFCQTVLPGNEAMLIPSEVAAGATVTLAIPDPSYWLSTAAHYYVNAPGIDTDDACVWSDGSKPLGNWAPYVAGGNTDSSGQTFFKIGWNPIYTDSNFVSEMPNFGLKITCSGGNCNGLPCSIDPSSDGIGGVTSSDQAVGAGGASFCVVTVPKGATANVVAFPVGSGSSSSSSASAKAAPTTSTTRTPTPTPTPTPSSTSKTSSTMQSTTSTTSLASSSSGTFSSSSSIPSSSSALLLHTTTSINTTSSAYPTADNSPHILFEVNGTTSVNANTASATAAGILKESSTTSASASASATKKSAAASTYVSGAGACLGLVFAFAAYFL